MLKKRYQNRRHASSALRHLGWLRLGDGDDVKGVFSRSVRSDEFVGKRCCRARAEDANPDLCLTVLKRSRASLTHANDASIRAYFGELSFCLTKSESFYPQLGGKIMDLCNSNNVS